MASLAKSGALSSVFVIYGAFAAFVATLIVTNGLGETSAGQFFQVMAFFTIGTSLAVFGGDTGLVRTISAQKAVGRYSAIPQLIRFAAVPALFFALAITLVALLYTVLGSSLADDYRVTLRVTASFLVVAALMALCFGVLRGLNRVVIFTALQNVLLPTLRILAILIAIFVAGSMVSLALAWTVPVVLVALVAFVLVKKYLPTAADDVAQDAIPAETRKSFWSFSSARGFSAVVESFLEWIDVLCVALFLGAGASGVYGAVNRMVRMGVMVDHIGRVVTGPSISAAIATRDYEQARNIFVGNTRVLIAVGWPFYISLAFFGPVLMGIFGEGFVAGAGVLWVICPAMMVAMAAGGVQSVLLMSGKSRWQLYNKLAALIVSLTLNLTLIPIWGLYGAVTAWSAAVLVDTFLAAYQVTRLVGIRAHPAEMIPIMLIASVLPLLGALGITTFMGYSWWAVVVFAITVGPLYLVLLYTFSHRVGLESLFKNKTRHHKTYTGKHF